MADIKIKIKLGDAEIEAEGSKADVDAVMAQWWVNVAASANVSSEDAGEPKVARIITKKTVNSVQKRSAGGTAAKDAAGDRFDANGLANKIKQHAQFPKYRDGILHGKDIYNKVALICQLSGEPLTSGEIHRTLTALNVKIGLPAVSKILKKKSGDFMNSVPRKVGSIAKYGLTSHAQSEFHKVLSAPLGK